MVRKKERQLTWICLKCGYKYLLDIHYCPRCNTVNREVDSFAQRAGRGVDSYD